MGNDEGPEARRWGLAAGAISATSAHASPRPDRLGGAERTPETEAVARRMLLRDHGVDGRDKLLARVEMLLGGGSCKQYDEAAAAYASAAPEQRRADPALAFVGQYGEEIRDRSLLAWNLGCAMAIAAFGSLPGFCSEEEAWATILRACARLRSAYASWNEFGKHYCLGAIFWETSDSLPPDLCSSPRIGAIVDQLLSSPGSPWRAVPWRLDAGATAQASPPAAGPAIALAPGGPRGKDPVPAQEGAAAASPRSKSRLVIIGAVCLLVVAGGALVFHFVGGSHDAAHKSAAPEHHGKH